ncbi:MAG: energy-coupling factor transporter transmembrane component T [Clostridiaceae bacterium]|nr:energy-coupling factor transporter transmembrane component T [Clostridiaceae bacterium]
MENIKDKLILDPRSKVLLLIIANIISFSHVEEKFIYLFLGFIAILFVISGILKTLIKFVAIIGTIISLQKYIIPIAPTMIIMLFSIIVNYAFKMVPCFMVGGLIIKTTTLRELILAMRKCKVPQKFIISISVTIRYFPAIKEEISHIRDAMKLKSIPLASRLESLMVPLMMSATSTVEELSEAAVTRGIDNPIKKTSYRNIKLGLIDYLAMIIGSAVFICSMLS